MEGGYFLYPSLYGQQKKWNKLLALSKRREAARAACKCEQAIPGRLIDAIIKDAV
jgi:hypothetical protein